MQRKNISNGFESYNKGSLFKGVQTALNDRKYTVGELPISYRVISHWASNGLLPEGVKADGGWKKFCFVEIIWLHAANKMRDFGLSLDRIAEVRNAVMHWDGRCRRYPVFEFFIAEALSSSADPYIVIFHDGHIMLARAEQIEQQKVLFGTRHMLLISLKSILKHVAGIDSTKEPDALFLLSSEEKALLEELRADNTGTIKAKIKNGSITEIEMATSILEPSSYSAAAKEMRAEGAYGRVVTQFENGIPKSVEKVKRKRFAR